MLSHIPITVSFSRFHLQSTHNTLAHTHAHTNTTTHTHTNTLTHTYTNSHHNTYTHKHAHIHIYTNAHHNTYTLTFILSFFVRYFITLCHLLLSPFFN